MIISGPPAYVFWLIFCTYTTMSSIRREGMGSLGMCKFNADESFLADCNGWLQSGGVISTQRRMPLLSKVWRCSRNMRQTLGGVAWVTFTWIMIIQTMLINLSKTLGRKKLRHQELVRGALWEPPIKIIYWNNIQMGNQCDQFRSKYLHLAT